MIFVECFNDELFLKIIGVPKKSIKHVAGKSNVIRHLLKIDANSIGIIDEDPNSIQPKQLEDFDIVNSEYTIKLLGYKGIPEKIIIMIPDFLENWLLKRAEINEIDPTSFNLPKSGNELHKISNLHKKMKFEKFLSKLAQVDDEIKIIQNWLREIL